MPTTTSQHRCAWLLLLLGGACLASAQDAPPPPLIKGLFYPQAMERPWYLSAGIVTFTTPEELAEEVRIRVPAVDLHALRRIHGGLHLDGRALVQVLQNNVSLGLRWTAPLNEHFHFGAGDDESYWWGALDIEGFRTRASGWMNRPSLSIGYRTRHELLVTLKAEGIITTALGYDVDGLRVDRDTDVLSGGALSLYLEQPFFKQRCLTLGFTALYSKFFWATWALFQTYDRPIFYPLITIGYIL